MAPIEARHLALGHVHNVTTIFIMKKTTSFTLSACILITCLSALADTISLTDLQAIKGSTGWKKIEVNRSVNGKPLSLDGKKYKTGLGVHAVSELLYAIPKGATRFTVTGGITDDIRSKGGSVVLRVEAGPDSSYLKDLATSGKLSATGKATHTFDIKLPANAEVIQLSVDDGSDGTTHDQVDWVNPTFHGKGKLTPRGKTKSSAIVAADNTPQPYWNDVKVVQVNRLAPRAHYIAYPDEASARKGGINRSKTPLRKSLNGTWKFQYSTTPSARPVDFFKTDFDTNSWHDIEVPKNWQAAGFGAPIYTNSTFPFNSKPPLIDQTFNPVGSYKRTFTVPSDWKSRRVLIHFAGVDSAFTLWVNGKEVGYSEGSRTPAEFDITQYLTTGDNDLAVEVIRFSSGAWLEDQDFWRLSGIFRDVELISQPAGQRIQDFTLLTPLDPTYTDATLDLTFNLENTKGGKIEIDLMDTTENKVIQSSSPITTEGVITIKAPVKTPKLWSAETPTLYSLIIRHFDSKGKLVEVIPWRFGFRWSEIKNNRQMLNGKPIVIAGVNRHEHSATHGHYCTVEEMRKDVILMKRLNFNALRTCHYPNAPELYALCDEYGIYVNDEANVESHGDQGIPKMPAFALSHHHRMQRMVARDKNFTSVISWSLGNESGSGGAHNDNYTWTKKNDPRPVGYQRHGTNAFTDFNSAFYRPPSAVSSYARGAKNKPMIQSEYAHAMGNSSGNLREYWEPHWQDNPSQGGFVWDWKDQGLKLPVPERSWIRIPGVDAEDIVVEGEQLSSKGLAGILYFCHGSEPQFSNPWTVKMKLKTAPKSSDSLAFFPLFSKDSSTGAVFLEKNALVFQTFGKDRNKLIAPLPETFFDGKDHTVTVSMDGKQVNFYLDGQNISTQPLLHPLKAKWRGYVAFGPAVGTALVPERLHAHAPMMLTAKLSKGLQSPQDMNTAECVVDLDFRKPVKVLATAPAGGDFYAYGGYWENRRGQLNPGNFCMNGVIAADGTPHPGAYAFQYVQQPYDTQLLDNTKDKITIRNRHFFQALNSNIRAEWTLTANGNPVQQGILEDLFIAPQETKQVRLPVKPIKQLAGVEYRIQLRYLLAKDTNWAKAGHCIAWDEFLVAYQPAPEPVSKGKLEVAEKQDAIHFQGNDFQASISKESGALTSYQFAGKELLVGPLSPDFWRGTTDNDRGARLNGNCAKWMNIESLSEPKLNHKRVSTSQHQVTVSGKLGDTGATLAVKFDVYADGRITTEVNYLPAVVATSETKGKKGKLSSKGYLLRFGMRARMTDDLTHLDWYGRGPRETYIDRNFELIGNYSNSVDGLFTDYSRPQENGNLTGIRHAFLSDGNGTGLAIIANPEAPVNLSVRRHRSQVLDAYKYSYQLPPSNAVWLNIDLKQMGVAGINTWGAKALPPYLLMDHQKMTYRFTLQGHKK